MLATIEPKARSLENVRYYSQALTQAAAAAAGGEDGAGAAQVRRPEWVKLAVL